MEFLLWNHHYWTWVRLRNQHFSDCEFSRPSIIGRLGLRKKYLDEIIYLNQHDLNIEIMFLNFITFKNHIVHVYDC